MRHLNILITAFIFAFALQGHAAKKPKKSLETKNKIVSAQKSNSMKTKRASVSLSDSDRDMTIKITSAPPTATTGKSSCPFRKRGSFAEKGRKAGAYTIQDASLAKANAINNRSASGIN